MVRANGSKINQLLKSIPPGTCAAAVHYYKQGYTHHLLHTYAESGWIEFFHRGVFQRKGDHCEWTGALYTIQEQLKLPVHAGGKTALQLLGKSHFLPLGKHAPVTLFGKPNIKLPLWFRSYDWGHPIHYFMPNLFGNAYEMGLSEKKLNTFSVRVSSLERAVMEFLYLVPAQESFQEGRRLMEGLTTLRPKLIQELLENCTSIKVKRLFMVLAEEANLPWFKKVDVQKIDFGQGKRVVVKGGHLHPKYLVTIPEREFKDRISEGNT